MIQIVSEIVRFLKICKRICFDIYTLPVADSNAMAVTKKTANQLRVIQRAMEQATKNQNHKNNKTYSRTDKAIKENMARQNQTKCTSSSNTLATKRNKSKLHGKITEKMA